MFSSIQGHKQASISHNSNDISQSGGNSRQLHVKESQSLEFRHESDNSNEVVILGEELGQRAVILSSNEACRVVQVQRQIHGNERQTSTIYNLI